ncbi:hypothetical protein D3C78_1819620 [compost metagenome]
MDLVATAGKCLGQQIELYAAAFVLYHIRRDGETDTNPQWLGDQGADMQQQDGTQQAVQESHAYSLANGSP